jgi:hypothetical protein
MTLEYPWTVHIVLWRIEGHLNIEVGNVFTNMKQAVREALKLVDAQGMDQLEYGPRYWLGPDGEMVRVISRFISGHGA